MENKLSAAPCTEFTAVLASRAPVPGGGGAAALAGALGTALCAMSGNLTLGKKKYADVEEEIRTIVADCEQLRLRFLELIDRDAEAFEPLSKAYSLPKDTPDYDKIMEEVTIGACRAPVAMMESACRAIELLERCGQICSRLMISDVGCGAALAGAALQAAALNVFVNTRLLPASAEAAALQAHAEDMLACYVPRAQAVTGEITETLKKKKA